MISIKRPEGMAGKVTHWLRRGSENNELDDFFVGAVFVCRYDPVFSGISPFAVDDLELGVVRHVLDGQAVGVGQLLAAVTHEEPFDVRRWFSGDVDVEEDLFADPDGRRLEVGAVDSGFDCRKKSNVNI